MSVIDAGVLRALTDDLGGDAEVVKELIESYLEEAPKLLAQGRAATQAADAPGVQHAYHTLKGTSATFGAMTLATQARTIEQAARAGQIPSLEQVAGVEVAFAAVRAELLLRLA